MADSMTSKPNLYCFTWHGMQRVTSRRGAHPSGEYDNTDAAIYVRLEDYEKLRGAGETTPHPFEGNTLGELCRVCGQHPTEHQ